MPTPLAARRLEIFSATRGDPAGFLRFERARLRFSLGTSLADLAIPVEVAADARAIVRSAATEIALLLSTHHRALVPPDELDRLILREEYANLPRVEAQLGPSGGGPDLRAAAQLCPAIHPALTGGLVTAWMGKGGRGRSLVALWIELLRQAFAEMAETGGREETPLLVALALAAEMGAAGRDVQGCLPPPPLDRYLRSAALAAAWLAARTGLARGVARRGAARGRPAAAAARGGRSRRAPSSAAGRRCSPAARRSTAATSRPASRAATSSPRGSGRARTRTPSRRTPPPPSQGDEELARRAEPAVAVARLRELVGAAVAAVEGGGGRARPRSRSARSCAPRARSRPPSGRTAPRKDLAARLAARAARRRPGASAPRRS